MTAVLIGSTTWGLGVPLAFTIAVITLVTSYVPYFGAIVSGTFAIVVLGSTILGAALAGMLGAALSSPAVAVGVMVRRRLAQRTGPATAQPQHSDVGDDPAERAQT